MQKFGIRFILCILPAFCILPALLVGTSACAAPATADSAATVRTDNSEAQNLPKESPRGGTMIMGHNKVIFSPDSFTAVHPDGSKHLVTYVQSHYSGRGTEGDNTQNLNDWYRLFIRRLGAAFVPAAPGGILAIAELENGKLKSASFFGAQPIPEESLNAVNESAVKQSVLTALQKTMSDSQLTFPSGLKSVEVRLGFAGNPAGGSYQLILDPLDLPAVQAGKQEADFLCKITPRTADDAGGMTLRCRMSLIVGP